MKAVLSFLAAATACLSLVSCDPQAFSMNVEMRYPSGSGLDLDGKSISVVYLENDPQKDSVFNEYMANGFAAAIENDYFGGNEAVSLFKLEKNAVADYSSTDSLRNLIMTTGSDVVFLFDAPAFGNVSVSDGQENSNGTDTYSLSVPVSITLYAYDSMSGKDSVMVWRGSRKLTQALDVTGVESRADVPSMLWGNLDLQGEEVGKLSAKVFTPTWKAEQYTIIYFDSPEAWNTASEAAYDYRWKDAITAWMTLLDTNNMMKRSCAEYNIALACYMLGDNELALKWLDQSDADYPVSLSAGMRKRINARMK